MRAKEFINEAKTQGKAQSMSKSKDATLPGVYVQTDLRNTDPYMQYRYGMAVAAARAVKKGEVEFDQESSWAENLVQVMYAAEDEETIKLASKLMGVAPRMIADRASREPDFVQTSSPVAQIKRNKYGV